VTVNETTVKSLPVGASFEKFASETAEYFALLDNNDVAIAVSGSVTLPTE